jgi:hypothetical protein
MGTGVWRAAYLLTRDEARRIAANIAKGRSCCARRRRQARRDEVARRILAMSAQCRLVFQLRTYRCNAANGRSGPLTAAIAFNTRPEDSADAAARWLKAN